MFLLLVSSILLTDYLLTLTGWGIYSKSHKTLIASLSQFGFFEARGMVSNTHWEKRGARELPIYLFGNISLDQKEDDEGGVELQASGETPECNL